MFTCNAWSNKNKNYWYKIVLGGLQVQLAFMSWWNNFIGPFLPFYYKLKGDHRINWSRNKKNRWTNTLVILCTNNGENKNWPSVYNYNNNRWFAFPNNYRKNQFSFEIYISGYQFCEPNMKLGKRLAHGTKESIR